MSEKILNFDLNRFFAYNAQRELNEDIRDVRYSKNVQNTTDVSVTFHIFCKESKFAWEVFFPYTGDLKYRRFKTKNEEYFIKRSKDILKNMGLTDNSIKRALKLSRLYWRDYGERKELPQLLERG